MCSILLSFHLSLECSWNNSEGATALRQRQLRKRCHLKREFGLFQTSSLLFHFSRSFYQMLAKVSCVEYLPPKIEKENRSLDFTLPVKRCVQLGSRQLKQRWRRRWPKHLLKSEFKLFKNLSLSMSSSLSSVGEFFWSWILKGCI